MEPDGLEPLLMEKPQTGRHPFLQASAQPPPKDL